MKKLSTSLLVLALSILIGCEGPAGPEGPPGAANIKTVEVSFDGDNINPDDNGDANIEYDISDITQEVVDGGVVQAYINIDGEDAWYSFPYIITSYMPDGSGDDILTTLEITYGYDVGLFDLLFFDSVTGFPYEQLSGDVKVVVIPPSEVESSKSYSYKTYEEAKSALGLS
jgi:hypothetical protein